MKLVEFRPIPGTRGYITENGIELVVTHGDFEAIQKLCTVTNKSALFQLRSAQKSLAYYEGKLAAVNEEMGEGSQKAFKLEEIIEQKHADIKKLKSEVKKEYFADYDNGTMSLPAGFWWLIEKIEGNTHLNTEIPYVELPEVGGKRPRPYQIEMVKEILKYKRATAVAATGLGKTLCLTMVTHCFVAAGKRVCLIEPTIELCRQTTTEFKKYFKKVCSIGGGAKFVAGSQVAISTIDSALAHIDKFDVVLVDEGHHSSATTYNETLFMAMSAKYFYGFTACPTRADGLSLGIHAACGPVVFKLETRWAIENKFLTPPKIIMLEISGIGSWRKDMPAVYAYKGAMRAEKTMRTIVDLIQKSLAKGNKTMVLFKTVQAGEETRKWAKKNLGFEFDVASAKFRKPLVDLREGKADLLVSNQALCSEGIDLPSVSTVINACQVSSENLVKQILGRGLRLAPGKESMTLIDICCLGYEPFEGAARKRLAIYQEITDNIKVIRI